MWSWGSAVPASPVSQIVVDRSGRRDSMSSGRYICGPSSQSSIVASANDTLTRGSSSTMVTVTEDGLPATIPDGSEPSDIVKVSLSLSASWLMVAQLAIPR